jgi:uncharacterized protein
MHNVLFYSTTVNTEPLLSAVVGLLQSAHVWLQTMKRLRRVPKVLWLTVTALLIALVAYNLVAYNHARQMLVFADAGLRTRPIESLSRWAKFKVLLTGVTIPKPVNTQTPGDLGLPYGTHHIPVGREITLEAWYVPRPNAVGTVLMFHGYSACKSALLPEAHALHAMGYAVLLVDLRGHGGSSGHMTSVGYLEADDVAAAAAYAQHDLAAAQPLILYGQSMGAAALLRAVAVNGVRPHAIIVESVFDRMLNTVRNRFRSMGLPPFPSAELLVFWGGRQLGFSGFQNNPADYAERATCPTLMLHGTDDPRATLEQSRAVFNRLAGVRQFVIFQDVRHESCYAADPEKWKAAVSSFLAAQRPGP